MGHESPPLLNGRIAPRDALLSLRITIVRSPPQAAGNLRLKLNAHPSPATRLYRFTLHLPPFILRP